MQRLSLDLSTISAMTSPCLLAEKDLPEPLSSFGFAMPGIRAAGEPPLVKPAPTAGQGEAHRDAGRHRVHGRRSPIGNQFGLHPALATAEVAEAFRKFLQLLDLVARQVAVPVNCQNLVAHICPGVEDECGFLASFSSVPIGMKCRLCAVLATEDGTRAACLTAFQSTAWQPLGFRASVAS